MWIRSQNKKRLVKCNFIKVNGNEIQVNFSDNSYSVVGIYSSEQKALKVLDMIQEHIKNMYIGTSNYMGKPFQMPQDSEVE